MKSLEEWSRANKAIADMPTYAELLIQRDDLLGTLDRLLLECTDPTTIRLLWEYPLGQTPGEIAAKAAIARVRGGK